MPWKARKLLKRLIQLPFGIESMMLEIICLSKSGRFSLKPALASLRSSLRYSKDRSTGVGVEAKPCGEAPVRSLSEK
jgi:hypothetical protein